ncbi:integrase core domain-containing protein [Bathymodiolus thermophilus thioautotrophic gill symbiont]|uniref:integrase core domain-containing protein n=1 Tax=Bathymodiolus thermophilus thioautotrophic gill symbiont TaxID=2360 RepID=UPI000F083F76|nr:integrase core domain-containing protein [Bathymodiolus thermophilus thioautotrophic gill symbiont]
MSILNDALEKHPHPEIFNTDQDSQYTSEIHIKRLKDLGIQISMDGKGRATDNICIERFWRSAKCERVYLNEYQSICELIVDADDYIKFYNHRRFHETLGYRKPMYVCRERVKLNQEKAKAS